MSIPLKPNISLAFHRKCIWLYIASILFCRTGICQCSTNAILSANSFINDNSIGTVNFSSPSNAVAEDGTNTIASVTLTLLGSATTNYLKATNFGFSIPASATICGITVSVKKRGTGINILNSITDNQVRLVVGGSITGNNAASSTEWSGAAAYSTYGSSTDTWGTSVTPTDINSPNFGVAISAVYGGVAGIALTAEIDYITLQVNYTNLMVPLILGEFTSAVSGNAVHNKWVMYEEEDNSLMHLQRSSDGSDWKNVKTFKLNKRVGQYFYEVTDHLIEKGNFHYRLELVTATDHRTYSNINTIRYKGESKVIAYPNPASSLIKIANVAGSEQFTLLAPDGKKISVPSVYFNGILQLDVKELETGTYFLKINDRILRVVKN